MKWSLLLIIPVLAMLMLPTQTARANATGPVFSDSLASINHSIWSQVNAGAGPGVASGTQGVDVTIPAGSANDPTTGVFGAGLASVCKLTGDFDVQVDFALVSWPNSNGVRVALAADPNYILSSDFATLPPFAVERVSLGSPSDDFPGAPREIYVTDLSDRASLGTLVPTSDLSGSLRLVRSGATETGYYYAGGWVVVHSGPSTSSDGSISLVAWSHNYAFAHQDVSATFSNFILNQGQFSCPTLSDNFDTTTLNTSTWSVANAGSGPSTAFTNGRVEITFPTSSVDNPSTHVFGSGLTSNCQLRGDFDLQVNFNLLAWPYANGIRVALAADPAYILSSNFSSQPPFATERVSFGKPDDFPGFPREVYLTDLGDRAASVTPTGDLSGSLRLIRVGNYENGLYFSTRYGWTIIHAGPATTQDVPFSIVAWSHNYAFTGQYAKLAFDNFVINSGQLVCQNRNISVLGFFADSRLGPVPLDFRKTESVNVLFAQGTVRETKPGRVLAWANITNIDHNGLQSLKLNETLPVDWNAYPGAISSAKIFVILADATKIQLTSGTSITINNSNPQSITLSIPDLNQTQIGSPLSSNESLLFGVPIQYSLIGTPPATSYPRDYMSVIGVDAWTGISFTGDKVVGGASTALTAYSRVLGDVNGDGKVNIYDLTLVASCFGARPGDPNWNAAADLNDDGVINVFDLSLVGAYFGS